MKKNELILSAAAAVIMTGCGGGSSSTTETTGTTGTTSSVPSFITQEAEITSVAKVESTANTVATVVNTFVPTQVPTSKSTARTSVTDKVMASKVDKRLKTAGMRAKDKLISLKKKTMVTAACDPIEEVVFDYQCSESGTLVVISTQGLNAEGQCVQTWTETASSCHDIWSDSFNNDDGTGNIVTYTYTGEENFSGQLIWEDTYALDDNQGMNSIASRYQDTYKGTGTETVEITGQDPVTYAWNENVNYAVTFADDYNLTNGVFAYNDKWSVDENGKLNISFSVNDQNEATFAYVVDMMSSYDYSQANKLASTMDGYVDLSYTLGTAAEERFSIATEALNFGYDWSVTNIASSTINGKIGSICTGGMIAIDTNRTIADNYADAYELPNDGLMNLTGAAGTTASLEYYEDTTGTHAVATVGAETKTYDTYADMQGQACQGEFLNPMGF